MSTNCVTPTSTGFRFSWSPPCTPSRSPSSTSGDSWPVVVQDDAREDSSPSARGALRDDLSAGTPPPDDHGVELGQALFRDDVRDAFKQARRRATGRSTCCCSSRPTSCGRCAGSASARPARRRLVGPGARPAHPLLALPAQRHRPPLPADRPARPAGPDRGRQPGEPGAVPARARSTPRRRSRGVRAALGRDPLRRAGPRSRGAIGPADPGCPRATRMTAASPTRCCTSSCHGRFKADDRRAGRSTSPRRRATVDPVPAARLLERLGKLAGAAGLPHFAFLSTCESAEPGGRGRRLGGLAQRLVRELGMPAVVAMTDRSRSRRPRPGRGVLPAPARARQVDLALAEATPGWPGGPTSRSGAGALQPAGRAARCSATPPTAT